LNLSFGKILNCYDSSIEYDIGTSIGSSGSPIISLDGNKIIKCTYYIKKEDLNKDVKLYHNSNNISEKKKEVIIQRDGEKGEILRNGIYRFNKEGKYFLKYKFDDSLNDLS
jgi:hypothetical protein